MYNEGGSKCRRRNGDVIKSWYVLRILMYPIIPCFFFLYQLSYRSPLETHTHTHTHMQRSNQSSWLRRWSETTSQLFVCVCVSVWSQTPLLHYYPKSQSTKGHLKKGQITFLFSGLCNGINNKKTKQNKTKLHYSHISNKLRCVGQM